MLCRFFCNIRLLWFLGKKSCIIKVKDKELKIHRYWLPGRLLCSIRSNRKWCKRRGSSLECQNCFFVYPIIDSNLTNLYVLYNNQFSGFSNSTKKCRKVSRNLSLAYVFPFLRLKRARTNEISVIIGIYSTNTKIIIQNTSTDFLPTKLRITFFF